MNLARKNFIHKNENFSCVHCQKKVTAGSGFIRNHCPFCLHCLHVDLDIPGDRLNPCKGVMRPICLKNIAVGEFQIVFECQKCQEAVCNKTQPDDDFDLICALSAKPSNF